MADKIYSYKTDPSTYIKGVLERFFPSVTLRIIFI